MNKLKRLRKEKVCFLCKDPLESYNFEPEDFGI